MDATTEHCNRCGNITYSFSKREAISESSYYCIKCAEELDKQYLLKNVCSLCTKLLDKGEIKFVMPSRLYSGYFFESLPIENRLMCAHCYIKVEKLNILKRPLVKMEQIRSRIGRSIGRKSLIRVKNRISL